MKNTAMQVTEETSAMAKRPPSAPLRAQLRQRMINRIAELKLKDVEAAQELGLSPGQMSRLRQGEDVFTLDRLIDAAANIGITVRMTATRPYGRG
jgi:predicted XRE-type DNA-binding protein